MLPLFRDEAVRHATERLDGHVLLPSRLSTWLIGGVLVAALALAAWFAATSSYARRQTVSGWLAPEGGVVRAIVPHEGVLVDVLVGEGDRVLSDTPLARVQPPRLDAERMYTVTAPTSGRVDTLLARVGQFVAAGSSVAVLAPTDEELVAELFVPPRAAGFVSAGQTVRLKYEAFPFQRFGSQEATVDAVSSTTLLPDETGLPGLHSSEPVFRARGRLKAQTVQAYGRTVPLRAGMLLSADIVTDRRTLAEWLLDPVYAAGRR